MCALNAETPRPTRTRPRGQSLVEFALSAALMILLISGIVDLGRAYFALIALDSVISEGAHWAAAYPGCVPTASDTLAGPPECQGTNSIVGRMLNENANLDLSRMVTVSVMPEDVAAWTANWVDGVPAKGQTILFSVAYQIDAVTPVTQLLTGGTMTITSQAKEVVRGVGLPDYDGAPTSQGGVGFVPTPPPPANVRQESLGLGGVCSGGYAKLIWDVQVATGYRLYASDGTTLLTEITPATTNYVSVYVGVGGSASYKVSAFTNNGLHEAESDQVSITVTCADVHPDNLTMACTATGATASWTPSATDSSVAGYALVRVWPFATVRKVFSGAVTSSGSFTFSSFWDSPARYQIQARASDGTLLGQPSNTVDLTCDVELSFIAAVQHFRNVSSVCNSGQVTLAWDRVAGVNGYEIRVGDDFDAGTYVTTINGDWPENTVVNVGSGSNKRFHIRAFLDTPGGRYYGQAGNSVYVACPALQVPSLSRTCGVMGNSATFTWNEVGDGSVAGYQLWRLPNGVLPATLRSTTLTSPSNPYSLTFQGGDNPASYEIRLVDALGNPIGTPSPTRSVNCAQPPQIRNFTYVPGSCIGISGNNNSYQWQWTTYTISGVPVTFRITDTTTGANLTPFSITTDSGYTRGWVTMSKQREGDQFTITAIQTSTGLPIASTTSVAVTLPNIGNACR